MARAWAGGWESGAQAGAGDRRHGPGPGARDPASRLRPAPGARPAPATRPGARQAAAQPKARSLEPESGARARGDVTAARPIAAGEAAPRDRGPSPGRAALEPGSGRRLPAGRPAGPAPVAPRAGSARAGRRALTQVVTHAPASGRREGSRVRRRSARGLVEQLGSGKAEVRLNWPCRRGPAGARRGALWRELQGLPSRVQRSPPCLCSWNAHYKLGIDGHKQRQGAGIAGRRETGRGGAGSGGGGVFCRISAGRGFSRSPHLPGSGLAWIWEQWGNRGQRQDSQALKLLGLVPF